MITDWSTIDDYLANRLPADERTRFEAALRTDTALAEAVAFYVTAKQTLKAEGQQQRRAELLARTPPLTRKPAWPYALAAAASLVLLLGIGWVLWSPQNTPREMADTYIEKDLTESVTMGGNTDAIQIAHDMLVKGQLDGAEKKIDDVLQREPTNADALKLAGIVSLRRGNYDEAINRFQTLSRLPNLYANPGLFYEALARIKRNQPDDKKAAKTLLQRVANQNLEGAVEARQFLNNL